MRIQRVNLYLDLILTSTAPTSEEPNLTPGVELLLLQSQFLRVELKTAKEISGHDENIFSYRLYLDIFSEKVQPVFFRDSPRKDSPESRRSDLEWLGNEIESIFNSQLNSGYLITVDEIIERNVYWKQTLSPEQSLLTRIKKALDYQPLNFTGEDAMYGSQPQWDKEPDYRKLLQEAYQMLTGH